VVRAGLILLSMAIFAMPVIAHYRTKTFETAERERIRADRENQMKTRGRVILFEEPDVITRQTVAFANGEVWFLLSDIAWIVLGGIGLVIGVALTVIRKSRKRKGAPAAGDGA